MRPLGPTMAPAALLLLALVTTFFVTPSLGEASSDTTEQVSTTICLITDEDLAVNAQVVGYNVAHQRATRSWIRELGFVWRTHDSKEHSLVVMSQEKEETTKDQDLGFTQAFFLDGEHITDIKSEGDEYNNKEDAGLTIKMLGVGDGQAEICEVTVENHLKLTLSLQKAPPGFQQAEDAGVQLTLIIREILATKHINGLLGQAYREFDGYVGTKYTSFPDMIESLGIPIQKDGSLSGDGLLDKDTSEFEVPNILATKWEESEWDEDDKLPESMEEDEDQDKSGVEEDEESITLPKFPGVFDDEETYDDVMHANNVDNDNEDEDEDDDRANAAGEDKDDSKGNDEDGEGDWEDESDAHGASDDEDEGDDNYARADDHQHNKDTGDEVERVGTSGTTMEI